MISIAPSAAPAAPDATAPTIYQLPIDVSNRIAAGEVIHRPASALKELLENALDAGATRIAITLVGGGLQTLRIADNGCGIHSSDYAIVCRRFTTSKLKQYDDLKSLRTYGFRGEALASVSHIAHLTLTSMTANDRVATRAAYRDGEVLAGTTEKVAGSGHGTVIQVDEMFFNLPARRAALRSVNEEYIRCLDVVQRYAVHNAGVSIICKKLSTDGGSAMTSSSIAGGVADVHTQANATVLDNIKQIYGSVIGRELLPVNYDCNDAAELSGLKLSGYVTNANFSLKKLNLTLFINHRLVECQPLRRAIEHHYQQYLPRYQHPFVYLALELNSEDIDVNVHPTKNEVHFLHESAVIDAIVQAVSDVLVGANNSRVFYTQTIIQTQPPVTPLAVSHEVLEGASASAQDNEQQATYSDEDDARDNADYNEEEATASTQAIKPLSSFAASGSTQARTTTQPAVGIKRKVRDNHLVRTDAQQAVGSMDMFVKRTSNAQQSTANNGHTADSAIEIDDEANNDQSSPLFQPLATDTSLQQTDNDKHPTSQLNIVKRPLPSPPTLTSVQQLLKQFAANAHPHLHKLLTEHTFVGCISHTYTLVQHRTRLYLLNLQQLSREMFKQLALRWFGQQYVLQLHRPIEVRKLLELAVKRERKAGNEKRAAYDIDVLMEHLLCRAAMLKEYFAIAIDVNAENMPLLTSLPSLLSGYAPPLANLPVFMLQLATNTDWQHEQQCFDDIAQHLADLYQLQPPVLYLHLNAVPLSDSKRQQQQWLYTAIQHVLLPAMRQLTHYEPSKQVTSGNVVVQIADLQQLYRVFERC